MPTFNPTTAGQPLEKQIVKCEGTSLDISSQLSNNTNIGDQEEGIIDEQTNWKRMQKPSPIDVGLEASDMLGRSPLPKWTTTTGNNKGGASNITDSIRIGRPQHKKAAEAEREVLAIKSKQEPMIVVCECAQIEP